MRPLSGLYLTEVLDTALAQFDTSKMLDTALAQLADNVQQIWSPEWQEVLFQTLQHLDATETEAVSTWWLQLSLQVRVTVITTIVWTYEAYSAILIDNSSLQLSGRLTRSVT
jgi:hypothetical protein